MVVTCSEIISRSRRDPLRGARSARLRLIASLEIRTADLLAAKAELERQQEEEKVKLRDRVLRLLLDYESATRKHKLLTSQLKTLEQQQRVARVSYRRGRGSTSQILGMNDKRDRLGEKIIDAEIKKDEAVRELLHLIGENNNEKSNK